MNENLWGMFISNSLLISATKDLFKKKNYEWFTDHLVLKAMRQLLELLYSGSPIKPVLEQLIKKNSRKNVVYLLFHKIKYRIVSMCQ